ncbi:hypothetical protein [Streptosporangium carneum]|nr:hypothetical protein [Streptosporangium carneum]
MSKEKPVFQHSHDLICRKAVDGFPGYSDPEIFPTLHRVVADD